MKELSGLLERLERYYDAAPRARSRTEELGPFTLFVAEFGWPYYARPRFGETARATSDDVRSVLARQLELGVPQALEWVGETTPGLLETVRSAGASVEECPLLVLDGQPRGSVGTARMLDPSETKALVTVQAAVAVSFQHGGMSTGSAGLADRDDRQRATAAAADSSIAPPTSASGPRTAAVFGPGAAESGPVGGGSYLSVAGVAEIVGVGVLPAYRRGGLARQLTYVLARDALDRGVTTVFCSAQTDEVARIYEHVGFRRVGTACIASGPAAVPS